SPLGRRSARSSRPCVRGREGRNATWAAAATSRPREHDVAGHCLFRRHFFLQDVPVLDDPVTVEAEDIDGDERLAVAAGVAAVDHDEIALSYDHAVLVGSARGKALDKAAQAGSFSGNEGVVLDIVGRKPSL